MPAISELMKTFSCQCYKAETRGVQGPFMRLEIARRSAAE